MGVMRTTRKQVESAFAYFCKAMGKRVATHYKDHGAWSLSYAPVYGGYAIREHLASGGEGEPMGSTRYPAGVFFQTLWFATRALEAKADDEALAKQAKQSKGGAK